MALTKGDKINFVALISWQVICYAEHMPLHTEYNHLLCNLKVSGSELIKSRALVNGIVLQLCLYRIGLVLEQMLIRLLYGYGYVCYTERVAI